MSTSPQTASSRSSSATYSLFASEAASASLLACAALRERGIAWQPDALSWQQWCTQELRDVWAPRLRELYDLAAATQMQRFVRHAQVLSLHLSPAAQHESQLAGEELLRHSEGARGKEVLLKLYREHQVGNLTPWFHGVLAARAAFFSRSQSSLILAFAWREWRAQQRLRVVLEADELWREFELEASEALLAVMPECLSGSWQLRGKKGRLRQEKEG